MTVLALTVLKRGRVRVTLSYALLPQKRAEEQAAEPVFVVAASNDDTAVGGADKKDKKASGRQASAKEEPAEHFYLYPKVDRTVGTTSVIAHSRLC